MSDKFPILIINSSAEVPYKTMFCKIPNFLIYGKNIVIFRLQDIYKALGVVCVCVCVCAICESSDTKSVIDTIVNKWGYTQHKLADNRYIKLIEKNAQQSNIKVHATKLINIKFYLYIKIIPSYLANESKHQVRLTSGQATLIPDISGECRTIPATS